MRSSNEIKKFYNYNSNEPTRLSQRVVKVYQEEGIKKLAAKIMANIIKYTLKYIKYTTNKLNYAIFNRYFLLEKFEGVKFKYFLNQYNAVDSERSVEIPFVMYFVQKETGKKIMEVGNVLNHYYPFNHVVVDKYERDKNVINEDIVDFNTVERFDLIISISTVEHVGFDELPVTPGKAINAIKKIIELLKPSGVAVITVPMGYNPEIDKLIRDNDINFSERFFLKRISRYNTWTETNVEEALTLKYAKKYPAANAVAFLIYRNKPDRQALNH
ncbi:MAG: hypothetical protein QW046_05445 [Candidatus Micrarchaeaceae archaeon]